MKPLKVKVSVTLDEETVQQIKQLSEDDDRSFSQYVNHILKKHIEKERQTIATPSV